MKVFVTSTSLHPLLYLECSLSGKYNNLNLWYARNKTVLSKDKIPGCLILALQLEVKVQVAIPTCYM